MTTNRTGLKSVEQFMSDYKAGYQPLWPLIVGPSTGVKHAPDVGSLVFRRVETVGDIEAKHINPKDTEIIQLSATDTRKTFKKYPMAIQYVLSQLQDSEGTQDVVNQVLDQHQRQFDKLLLSGEGTANNNVVNNALFFSSDTNFTTESSVEIASGDGRLADFHTKVVANVTKADQVAGRKLLVFFGSNITPLYNGVYSAAGKAWKSLLSEVIGGNYQLVQMPTDVTPSSNHGWMIVNLDQIKVHYTSVPQLLKTGSNDEKMYDWFNFLMGSCMVDVLMKDAIIRQPATLA